MESPADPRGIPKGQLMVSFKYGALLLAVACVTACSRGKSALGDDSSKPLPNVAAQATLSKERQASLALVIDGKPYGVEDIDRRLGDQLYRLRSVALRELLANELIPSEARRRGITVKELLSQEIDQKVKAPTDEELRSTYEAAQRKGDIPSDKPFDEVKAGFREVRTSVTAGDRQKAFFDELLEKHHVYINLAALGRPAMHLTEDGPRAGAADAAIKLVEYTDFASKNCKLGHATIEALLRERGQSVSFHFRHVPNNKENPASQKAAEAALCAHEQGKYWEYRKLLFANQGRLDHPALIGYAADATLNVSAFEQCLAAGKMAASIERDTEEAKKNQLQGSPTYSLNGTPLSGALEPEYFNDLIKTELRWLEWSKKGATTAVHSAQTAKFEK